MSKENNLTDFLTDVADAIREKKGSSEKINPQDFSEEIRSIESGGEVNAFGKVMIDDGRGVSGIGHVIIRQGATFIADYAYANSSIEKLDIPNSVITYGARICENCSSLRKVNFPITAIEIPKCFFVECTFESYTVAEHFKRIGYAPFYNCKNLKFVEVLGDLEYIGHYAFEACSNLRTIKLKKVKQMEPSAFHNISPTVIIDSNVVPEIPAKPSFGQNIQFYVPDESVDTYKSATNWSYYADKIKPLSEYVEPTTE